MKTALITLGLLAALNASADTFADTDNQGGGKITILTDACPATPSESRAYFYTKDGTTEDGCWRYDNDTIVVQWERQGRKRYPIKYFTLRGHYRDFKSF